MARLAGFMVRVVSLVILFLSHVKNFLNFKLIYSLSFPCDSGMCHRLFWEAQKITFTLVLCRPMLFSYIFQAISVVIFPCRYYARSPVCRDKKKNSRFRCGLFFHSFYIYSFEPNEGSFDVCSAHVSREFAICSDDAMTWHDDGDGVLVFCHADGTCDTRSCDGASDVAVGGSLSVWYGGGGLPDITLKRCAFHVQRYVERSSFSAEVFFELFFGLVEDSFVFLLPLMAVFRQVMCSDGDKCTFFCDEVDMTDG